MKAKAERNLQTVQSNPFILKAGKLRRGLWETTRGHVVLVWFPDSRHMPVVLSSKTELSLCALDPMLHLWSRESAAVVGERVLFSPQHDSVCVFSSG